MTGKEQFFVFVFVEAHLYPSHPSVQKHRVRDSYSKWKIAQLPNDIPSWSKVNLLRTSGIELIDAEVTQKAICYDPWVRGQDCCKCRILLLCNVQCMKRYTFFSPHSLVSTMTDSFPNSLMSVPFPTRDGKVLANWTTDTSLGLVVPTFHRTLHNVLLECWVSCPIFPWTLHNVLLECQVSCLLV